MLRNESRTASNIKSRVNRQSVETAIESTLQKLKLYSSVPMNGLALFVGTILTDDNKEKKISIAIEPMKPINTTLYMCDNRFHTKDLEALCQNHDTFGFIIMDGNGCLFGRVNDNNREVLYKFSVDLPKKHGRGGQSALRFARMRVEKRQNYVRACTEHSTKCFITDNMCNVKGLILAGSAEFKNVLSQSDLFDPRLKEKVLGTVDIAYGFENGFSEAIQKSKHLMEHTRFIKECTILQSFFDEITLDTGKICVGIDQTIQALEMGAVKTLIVWTELPIIRYTCTNDLIVYDPKHIVGDVIEEEEFVEWIAQNYMKFGAELELVTDVSNEGSQFTKGFGGLGGILTWPVEFQQFDSSIVIDDDFQVFDEGF